MPAPAQVPVARSAYTLYLTELATDASVFLHSVGGFALQFEDTFTTILTFYGEDFIYRSIQVINSGINNIRRSGVHILPVVAHHVGACVQGACSSPGDTSCVVAVPSQRQTIFGCGQVLVNLFVYLLGSGFRYIGIGCFHYFDGHQGDFAKSTYQVEVAISTEKQSFTFGTDILSIVFVCAILDVIQNFITLVDDFIVLIPVCTQGTVGSGVFEVIVHGCLFTTVAGITSFFGVFTTYHVYHESRNTRRDIITTHQVVDVVHLSAYKGVRGVVFRELAQRIAVQEVITRTE